MRHFTVVFGECGSSCICITQQPTPSLEEAEKAVSSMKLGKAAEPDEIPAELLKHGQGMPIKAMHKIIKAFGRQGNGQRTGLCPLSYPFTRRVIPQYVATIARYL